ncbi:hypothetical protein [Herbiconiux sp.]|uniref:hypothetical protein n=1 Tax=Herbiconiux sp. TaxID=1871186 RepID=UPI0025BE79A1|nr:hypothetical protein [Herbiconiux sp.]
MRHRVPHGAGRSDHVDVQNPQPLLVVETLEEFAYPFGSYWAGVTEAAAAAS